MQDNQSSHLPLRVNQLDANEADNYIFEIIFDKVHDIFKHFKTSFLSEYKPEIIATIKLLLWKFTLQYDGRTAGQRMLQIFYADRRSSNTGTMSPLSKWQSVSYATLCIVLPWLNSRAEDLTRGISPTHLHKVKQILSVTNAVWSAFTLGNFLLFLTYGNYLHLVERVVGIQSMHPGARTLRNIGFDYSTREILWHGFAEFIFFAMPFLNLKRLQRLVFGVQSSLNGADPHTACTVCESWPTNPHQMEDCHHVFCYYCAASSILTDGSLQCKSCQVKISSVEQLKVAELNVNTVK